MVVSFGLARAAAAQFLESNPELAAKYAHPQLVSTIAKWMQLPSVVSARIAFHNLVEDGTLTRTDNGNEETDRAEAVKRAKETIRRVEEQVASQPLSRDDYEYFASLSPRQLSELYFGEDGSACNEFAVRYRAAMRQWGFQEPLRYNDTPPAPDWAEGLV